MNKLLFLNWSLKIALYAMLIHAAFNSDLPQYTDKAVPYRLIFYPIASVLVYVLWKMYTKITNRSTNYPYVMDLLLTFVVTFDMYGNYANLYDSLWWWDDAMHLLLTIPWVLAFAFTVRNMNLETWVFVGLVIGYGAVTHIIWELLEFATFVQKNRVESVSAYQDTMGDLLLSLVGTVIGSCIALKIFGNKHASRKTT